MHKVWSVLCFALIFAPAAALGTQSKEVQAYLHRARTGIAEGDFQKALAAAERAFAVDPGSAEALGHKATALNRLERYREAEAAAYASLRLESSNAYAYENLAWAQVRRGNYKDAANAASRALTFKPRSALAYALRAQAHEGLGLSREALADLGKAAELDPVAYGASLGRVKNGGRLLAGGGTGPPQWLIVLVVSLVVLVPLALWLSRGGEAPVSEDELAPAAGLAVGSVLGGRYKLVHVIGRGGMGQVWEGVDVTLDRPVALKEVHCRRSEREREMRENFVKEARTIASLRHPNIAEIYQILNLPQGLFMVLEMLRGRTLQHILVEQKVLPLNEIKRYLEPVCAALEYAHERKLVHRDIKPANIMATEDGPVKLLDFGIARRIGAGEARALKAAAGKDGPQFAARTEHVYGTPGYMPPEAEWGVVGAFTDIFALGITFYEMLTGNLAPAPFPGDVSPGVDELMRRSVEPDYTRRLASAREFAARLAGL